MVTPSGCGSLAVTKGFGPEAVAAARAAGLTDIGENYASELQAKAPGPPGTRWHFLGAVQRNKVGALAPLVDVWQGVARLAEGERIARFAPGARVLIQVDYTGLPGRNGCAPEDVPALVEALRGVGLDVAGLMTVAPPDPSAASAAFGSLGRLADALEPARTVDGNERGPRGGGRRRVHDGAGRPGPVRGATAGPGALVVPPTPTSRHYAVPEQEKVWHPRS